MSFIAWPPFAHLRRNGEQSGSREIRKNRSAPPGRAMSRGFFSRVLIIAPFLPSMRNCTIVLAFAQADRTYNASPNAKEKALSLTLSEISQGDGAFSGSRLA